MRTGMQHSRRGGFTLIELLVVVSILAILAALTMAGIGRVRQGQAASTTEGTVKKLQVGLNGQLLAAMEDAGKNRDHQAIIEQAISDPDKERSRAILAYFYSKRNFPTNFGEANLPFIGTPPIPGNRAFARIPATTGLSLDQQSAVLLYIIAHDMGARGTSIDSDGSLTGAEVTVEDPNNPNLKYQAYKDAYGTPIAFRRWYGANVTHPDYSLLQAPPYINPKDPSKDPFDRVGKLQAAWTARTGIRNALNNLSAIQIDFDGLNKVVTVVSAGADKTFGTDDDVYGFKLAQFGGKAN